MMKLKRVLKYGVLAGIVVVLVSAGVLYLLAASVPREYRPAVLTPAERKAAAKDFINNRILKDFGNAAQKNESYRWSITQDQLNLALASTAEIADILPRGRAEDVEQMLAKAGVEKPAVDLGAGRLTLMIKSSQMSKVLSVALSFSFTPAKRLLVRLRGARVGGLPIPKAVVRDRLTNLKRAAMKWHGPDQRTTGGASEGEGGFFGPSSADFGAVLGAVVAAIDEQAISTELTWPVGKKRVRIEGIRISPGLLTLDIMPIDRKVPVVVGPASGR